MSIMFIQIKILLNGKILIAQLIKK